MKKQFIKLFAILGCLMLFVAMSQAKIADGVEFEVPFSFIVKEKTYPAGKYSIERLNGSNPNLLTLKNDAGNVKTILLTQSVNSKNPSGQAVLSFKREGENYFLQSLWLTSENQGFQFLTNETESERRQSETVQIAKK